jgi:nucleotide-binding universal stress UspA family protein
LKLLVATDFSPAATEVLRVATELAQGLSADTLILHVALPETSLIGGDVKEIPHDHGSFEPCSKEKRLVQEAAQAMIAKGLTASGEVVAGPCADVILRQAEDIGADMIIVGSHGFGAVLRALLGSVSASILKRTRCPVVVVPPARTKRS